MKHTEVRGIGSRIAALRKAKGWTQVELAERINASDKTVSKWEKDVGEPSLAYFPIMAEIFGVTIDYLITGEGCGAIFEEPQSGEGVGSSNDKKLPDHIRELVERKYAENGVLKLEEFSKISYDSALLPYAKEILYGYPIHKIEIVMKRLEEEDDKTLFRRFIDEGKNQYAQLIVDGEREKILDDALRRVMSEISVCNILAPSRESISRAKRSAFARSLADVVNEETIKRLEGYDKIRFERSCMRRRGEFFDRIKGVNVEDKKEIILRALELTRKNLCEEMPLHWELGKLKDEMPKSYFLDLIRKKDLERCAMDLGRLYKAILRDRNLLVKDGTLWEVAQTDYVTFNLQMRGDSLNREELLAEFNANDEGGFAEWKKFYRYYDEKKAAKQIDMDLTAKELREIVESIFR